MEQLIFHIDVNNAYLSWTAVERLKNGETLDVREVPSVIAGSEKTRNGIVLAKSYPAKKLGIYTPETLYSARKKCKNLLILPPDHKLYASYSNRLYEYLKTYSPEIIRYSVDECFLNMTGSNLLFGDPIKLAYKIKEEVYQKFGFTVNIGIGNNKFCAKMASDFEKPNKVHTLFNSEIKEKMWPLEIEDLFMIGKKSSATLRKLNVNTIEDLATFDIQILRKYFKSMAKTMIDHANGIDNESFFGPKPKSHTISNELTFSNDLYLPKNILNQLLLISSLVGKRLRDEGYFTSCVAINFKNDEFETYSKQMKLENPINTDEEIYEAVKTVFKLGWRKDPIRLIGIRLSNFSKEQYQQLSLFDKNKPKNKKYQKAVDNINDKYGANSIIKASLLKKKEDD